MDRLHRLQAADDMPGCACGAAIRAVDGPQPALMTTMGWIFFTLTLVILVVALVMACVATGRRRRETLGWIG